VTFEAFVTQREVTSPHTNLSNMVWVFSVHASLSFMRNKMRNAHKMLEVSCRMRFGFDFPLNPGHKQANWWKPQAANS